MTNNAAETTNGGGSPEDFDNGPSASAQEEVAGVEERIRELEDEVAFHRGGHRDAVAQIEAYEKERAELREQLTARDKEIRRLKDQLEARPEVSEQGTVAYQEVESDITFLRGEKENLVEKRGIRVLVAYSERRRNIYDGHQDLFNAMAAYVEGGRLRSKGIEGEVTDWLVTQYPNREERMEAVREERDALRGDLIKMYAQDYFFRMSRGWSVREPQPKQKGRPTSEESIRMEAYKVVSERMGDFMNRPRTESARKGEANMINRREYGNVRREALDELRDSERYRRVSELLSHQISLKRRIDNKSSRTSRSLQT